jgi:hypothetical protein
MTMNGTQDEGVKFACECLGFTGPPSMEELFEFYAANHREWTTLQYVHYSVLFDAARDTFNFCVKEETCPGSATAKDS